MRAVQSHAFWVCRLFTGIVCLVLLTLYPCWFFTHCVGIDIGAEAEADGANAVVTDGRVDWVDPTGASFVVFARSSVLAI
jgi:hypothetical protein